MEKQSKYFVWGALSVLVPLLLYAFAPRPKTKVLSETASLTPTETTTLPPVISEAIPSGVEGPTASPSATLTPTPTKKPKQPIPLPVSSMEVNALIERFSAQYSVDPNVMRHLAICESGFNSSAINGAYVGLFQFGTVTWKNLRKEIGEDVNTYLRFSAEESVQTAAYALSQGKRGIWPNCAP
jgi:hypothetical protein